MNISRKWLSEYIEISTYSNSEIQEALTRSGVEVESVYNLSDANGVIVGQVVSIEPHPNADKLSVCSVLTDDCEYQVVCGANNVILDSKVAYAKIGSVIGEKKIEEVTIRGVDSYGMLCSLSELGVEDRVIDDQNKDGIVILPNESIVGSSVLTVLDLDDTIFELGLTPNRSDCLSIIGVAYELSAILNIPLKNKVIKYPEIDNDNNLIELFVSSAHTDYFSLMPLHKIKVTDSPPFIKARLMASGIKPINNVVDITNYVLIETGQPLHAFDLHKSGTNIEVRSGFKGEKIVTLDESELSLSPNDIVVSNQSSGLSVAGIIGGANSKISKYTTDILLEAAVFNKDVIRESVKSLAVKTDSSIRFEKGVDKQRTNMAMKLAVSLLIEYADAKVSCSAVVYENQKSHIENDIIELSYKKLCKYIGFKIDVKEVVDILKRLKFSFKYENESFKVNKLSRRLDIETDVCVIEEIVRLYGLENIDPVLPVLKLKSSSVDGIDNKVLIIKSVLQGMGYSEAITYALTNEQKASIILEDNESLVKVNNPISSEREYLRKSILPSLVDAVSYNIDRQNTDVKLYELSQVNYMRNGEIITEGKLAGAISGHVLEYPLFNFKMTSDFYFVKGTIQKLFGISGSFDGVDYEIVPCDNPPAFFHPYQSAQIVKKSNVIGYLGKVHPNVSKHDIYVFEGFLGEFKDIISDDVVVGTITTLPSIKRDLSIVVPVKTSALSMIKKCMELQISDLEDIFVYDIYTDETIIGFKSVTFRLKFSNKEITLTDEDVNAHINDIIETFKEEFNAKLR